MALEQAQLEGDRDEALLRAVVEVALEPAPLRVARGHDPLTGGVQLHDAGGQLGLEALPLERDPGGRADPLEQFRLVGQRGVVESAATGRRPLRPASRRGRSRRLETLPGSRPCRRKHQSAAASREHERRVAERLPERLAQRPGSGARCNATTRPPSGSRELLAEHPQEEREGDGDEQAEVIA